MVRPALFALAAIVLLSIVLVSRPIPAPPPPSRGVVLENVKLTLYPEQDPSAHWEFVAGRVEQDPSTREAKVTGLQTGQRFVQTRLDMRLSAPEVTIDRIDNMRVPYAKAEILKGCMIVELGKAGLPAVTIDQRQGFDAPSVSIESPKMIGTAKGFKSDFQIENIESPAPDFSFLPKEEKHPCKVVGGTE